MKTRMLVVVALIVGVANVNAVVIPVTSVADSGVGSLRNALASAANGDVIDATGISGTILLTSGELLVTNSLFILGPGPAALAINGNAASRVFHIGSNTVVKIFTLTITNGLAAGASFPDQSGGGIFNYHATLTVVNCAIAGNSVTNDNSFGGGIYSNGRSGTATLTVANCTLSGNSASSGEGGGIYNDGESGSATLTVNNSTISSNSAVASGGGIENDGYGGNATLTIANSTLSGNSATNGGGGIYNDGFEGSATLTIANSTLSGNSAIGGGGVFIDGYDGNATMTIANSTLSGNSAFVGGGGGIHNVDATLTVSNCTLSGNSTAYYYYASGGGIYNDGEDGSATMTIANSTLSGNSATSYGGGIYNYGYYGSATLTVSNCTLSGNSADVDGGGIDNYGDFSGSATLTIANSTVSGNSAFEGGGGGIYNDAQDGSAMMTVSNCTLSGNSADVDGGGIDNENATLMIVTSTVSGNSATNGGGGILNLGSVSIANSTISGNSATNGGGGILNLGAVSIANSTLSGNSATYGGGGGIDNDGEYDDATLTIVNSTFSGNSATNGGGIFNDGSTGFAMLTIVNSTLSGNSATNGGGVYNDSGEYGSATLEIESTILNTGASGGNIFNDSGTVTSDGYNLSSDDGGGYLTNTTDQINTDPMLGPLQDNGGPTFTHALLPGSPAIDAGDPNFVAPPDYDQRGSGFPRVIANWSGSPRIDIGAYEASPTYTVGDGIPDSYRAHYFGGDGTMTNNQSCALCDADGTGQNNLFKYTAGLDPTNPASVFVLKIANVVGQPTYKDLIFNPEVSGRTYTTEFTTNLVGTPYATLPGIGGPTTNVNEVTVTDLNAVEQQKFYRIDISLP